MTDNIAPDPKRGRTCAACGKKSAKEEFLRFVLSPDDEICCDVRGKIQSRGVYLCPLKDCVQKGLKKRVFSRFFEKDNLEPAIGELASSVLKSYEIYLFSLMELATKAGKLSFGSSAVIDAVDKGRACLILISGDAGRSVSEKAEYLSKAKNIELAVMPDKLKMAEKLERAVTAIMAVTDGGFAARLKLGWQVCKSVKLWY